MTAAIVGVFIGGAINYYVQSKLAERSERGQLRSALRLLNGEIQQATRVLNTTAATKGIWPHAGMSLVTARFWEQALPTVAAYASHETWTTLAQVYLDLSGIEAGVRVIAAERGDEWDDSYPVFIAKAYEAIERAGETLKSLGDVEWMKDLGRS